MIVINEQSHTMKFNLSCLRLNGKHTEMLSERKRTLTFIYSSFLILRSRKVRPREVKEFIHNHLVIHLVEKLRQDLFLLG